MDPRLKAKPPVTTVHGPFKENQLPMQCYPYHGWDHSWHQYPTKLHFKLEGEGRTHPLSRSGKCSTAGKGFSSASSATNRELPSPEGVIKGVEMSKEGRGGRVPYPQCIL